MDFNCKEDKKKRNLQALKIFGGFFGLVYVLSTISTNIMAYNSSYRLKDKISMPYLTPTAFFNDIESYEENNKRAADKNNDGLISKDELITHLSGMDPGDVVRNSVWGKRSWICYDQAGDQYKKALDYRVANNFYVGGKDVKIIWSNFNNSGCRKDLPRGINEEDLMRVFDLNDDGKVSIEEALEIELQDYDGAWRYIPHPY